MFTSRAEYRLLLRVDNADLRLTAKGREAGLVDDDRWALFEGRQGRYRANLEQIRRSTVRDVTGIRIPAEQWLQRPGTSLDGVLAQGLELHQPLSRLDVASLETTVRYRGYLKRQELEVARRSRTRATPDTGRFPLCQGPWSLDRSCSAPHSRSSGDDRPGRASAWRHPSRSCCFSHLRFSRNLIISGAWSSATNSPDGQRRPE